MTDLNIEIPARQRRMDDAKLRPVYGRSGVPLVKPQPKDAEAEPLPRDLMRRLADV